MSKQEDKDKLSNTIELLIAENRAIFDNQVGKHGQHGGYTSYVEYLDNMTNTQLLELLCAYIYD